MNTELQAPGLTADWLSGWMAAIGAAVLLPGLRLRWTEDVVPFAVFEWDGDDIAGALAEAMPTPESIRESVIAQERSGCMTFTGTVTIAAYRERAAVERRTHSVHLASSVSDLKRDDPPKKGRKKKGQEGIEAAVGTQGKDDEPGETTESAADKKEKLLLEHGPFDPPSQGKDSRWSKMNACTIDLHARKGDLKDRLLASFNGHGERFQGDGLGFDSRRLPAGVQADGKPSEVCVDPVIELLCFSSLALFPVRGDGRRRIVQRGWTNAPSRPHSFSWSAWRPALDRWAIDAFLDVADHTEDGVIARYGVIPYRTSAKQDIRRAYFSERLS